MHSFFRDIRYAVRQLRKAPGFTLTAVLTLALGIGALATVATWTNAVLFNPWPHVDAPRSLRFVDATVLGSNGYSVHYDQFQFLRQEGRSFRDTAAFAHTTLTLALPDAVADAQPQAIHAGVVSSNYFQLLGLKPLAGRFFQADANDHAYGANDEIVLSDGLWRDRFNGDTGVVGRVVSVNRHAFTVIGVAPPEFAGIYGGLAEAAWVPLSSLRDLSADAPADPLLHYGLQVVVRLPQGVANRAAAAELHTVARNFASQQHDSSYNGWGLNLRDSTDFQRGLMGMIAEQLPMLFGASALLMILVCVNIASLLGQHAARRRREVAIRTSLGASPGTIAAQVLTETGLLAAMGALAGWAASVAMSKSLYVLLPGFGMPVAFNLHSDARVLLFVAALAVLVTLACGLYPVRQSLRVSQMEALHEGGAAVAGAARNRRGLRVLAGLRILPGLQLGICFVVLVCCGLLTRTALNIFHLDTGFDRDHYLTATIELSRSGYAAERVQRFEAALLDKLRNSPGVASATLATHLPMGDWGSGNTQDFSISGYVPARGEDMEVVTDFDGPDFFHTMRIPLVQGRDFDRQDNAQSADVAIVSETMAHRYWPKGDAIGSSVIVDKRPRRIVGVARTFAYHSANDTDHAPVLFLPLAQGAPGYGYVLIALRSRTTAAAVAGQLRQAVASLDPALPLEDVRSLREVTGEQYQMSRIPAELLGVYALSSVLVAMLGLYAVMSYSVLSRHREFALRIALGSTRGGIFRLVLSGNTEVAIVGLTTGALGSIAAARLLRSLLFGVAPFDPVSYCAAAAFLLLTIFVSGMIPARRAASIEPMQALRSE